MKTLDRALFRDLARLRAQVLTLALVVAAGACVFVAMKMALDSIDGARASYFREQRFGDLFASLKRAPRTLLTDLAAIPGVAEIEGRVVGDVPVYLHGPPSTVHLVSLDPLKERPLDAVRIRKGRLPVEGHDDEIVLNEPFAEATRLAPGDELPAVLNGRLRRLRVVGAGISPEFVFQLAPGSIAPNDERYGVAWMNRAPLEAAFDLRGAFNDVVVQLGPGADEAEVKAAIDRRLVPYGGRDAYGRDEQPAAKNLDARIQRLRAMLVFLPTMFLLVAAFVLNVVLGRLVHGQREQVGALKAFGYTNARLARHYLSLSILAVLPGAVAGIALGIELGSLLVRTFVHYFRLPLAGSPAADWKASAGALSVVLAAATLGALQAVRSVTRLHPVEAMRPPSPPVYRRGLLEHLRLVRRLPAALLMVGRNLRLSPLRTSASVVALAFATALCVTGTFFGGALDALMRHQFDTAMREDLSVAFVRPIGRESCSSLRAVAGVASCEPLASVPVRARLGAQSKQVALTALAEEGQLRSIVDLAGRTVDVPPEGVLISRRLLRRLGGQVGDSVILETIEGRPRQRSLPVSAAVDDELGLNLYASIDTLTQFLGESPPMSAALLRVEPGAEARVVQRLREMPAVIGVTSRAAVMADFESAVGQSMRALTVILAVFAAALAVAVVYNGARVALAERARDLASLRVLGFTRAEVSLILLGEMAVELGAGVPLGLLLGRWLAGLSSTAIASDEARIPLVVTPATWILAASVVLLASLLSGLQMRRLIDRLDLVEVLKTRE